ncbi:phospholipid/cholesterol/gamma-HCH transport system substrate-binding protein [Marinobacter persicus]|uniref:Phospholipid/cholesterol/gamma-HCH transport system substrate-binding protein n=1 Tax=Marinobacter persicus TaxID=930118 RepID=A0A1I3PKR2_9GAMM|nr:outer membrane lipid asymmetry maintenance protein MlaD [Marinobacter persicus]GHD54061.1 outer membrane lipid asymmetry maintenance protein MlaD [Marinobacter persicus]SFJ22063.1 phospholipid/cholesterol/gamma-HCH transport system substrate-binding protein [Marinobacter persicus]
MGNRSIEVIVGLFMIAGLAALLFLALQVSGLSPQATSDRYTLYANFNDSGGLAPRSRVAMAGVTIGTIESVTLDKETFQARVKMAIDADVDNIPADSAAVIRTSGLLGDQYIDVSVGGDMESLQPGDTFYSTQSAMNLERLISNFASGR